MTTEDIVRNQLSLHVHEILIGPKKNATNPQPARIRLRCLKCSTTSPIILTDLYAVMRFLKGAAAKSCFSASPITESFIQRNRCAKCDL